MINEIKDYISEYNTSHSPYTLSMRQCGHVHHHVLTLTDNRKGLCVDVCIDIDAITELVIPVDQILERHISHMKDMLTKYRCDC